MFHAGGYGVAYRLDDEILINFLNRRFHMSDHIKGQSTGPKTQVGKANSSKMRVRLLPLRKGI